jgi:hypothetical protein
MQDELGRARGLQGEKYQHAHRRCQEQEAATKSFNKERR